MRYIIISDIHGNIEALKSVLTIADEHPDAHIVSLGDIVGYGADPGACLSIVQGIARISLAGNHDHAAVGLTDIRYFNTYAREAVLWTSGQLTENERGYLRGLPLFKRAEGAYFLVHSSPDSPEEWRYIITLSDAQESFPAFEEPLCFVGHSHSPMVFGIAPNGRCHREYRETISLKEGYRYIVNVGSVGQPRDGDWRACIVVYDDQAKTIEYKRLEYDLPSAQKKIIDAGLPSFLARRLQQGV